MNTGDIILGKEGKICLTTDGKIILVGNEPVIYIGGIPLPIWMATHTKSECRIETWKKTFRYKTVWDGERFRRDFISEIDGGKLSLPMSPIHGTKINPLFENVQYWELEGSYEKDEGADDGTKDYLMDFDNFNWSSLDNIWSMHYINEDLIGKVDLKGFTDAGVYSSRAFISPVIEYFSNHFGSVRDIPGSEDVSELDVFVSKALWPLCYTRSNFYSSHPAYSPWCYISGKGVMSDDTYNSTLSVEAMRVQGGISVRGSNDNIPYYMLVGGERFEKDYGGPNGFGSAIPMFTFGTGFTTEIGTEQVVNVNIPVPGVKKNDHYAILFGSMKFPSITFN